MELYTQLVQLFERCRTGTLEIEIISIPIATANPHEVLCDGNFVGLTKKALTGAFLYARKVFTSRSAGDVLSDDIHQSTCIILLFDPEYLTAANLRKRRISKIIEHSWTDAEYLCKAELNFLDSILCSPLHRQSKSPTLWHHRKWLLSSVYSAWLLSLPMQDKLQRTQDFLESEMSAVLKAADRHSNNYYAWQYARNLIQIVENVFRPLGASVADGSKIYDKMHTWCLQHPSDTSGWSFLLFLLSRPSISSTAVVDVVESVTAFTVRLRWKKEALWFFIFQIFATFRSLPRVMEVFEHTKAEFIANGCEIPSFRGIDLIAS